MEDTAFRSIATRRLRIRRFRPADATALAGYRSDPAVARYQAWDCPYPLAEARAFIESLAPLAPGRPGTWFQFAVTVAPEEALVGDCGLHTTEDDPPQGELGFTLASAHQGHGYAAEAVEAIAGYVFGTLGMSRLFSITDLRNLRAQRLLERVGFQQEARLRGSTVSDGELLYARLATERRRSPGDPC